MAVLEADITRDLGVDRTWGFGWTAFALLVSRCSVAWWPAPFAGSAGGSVPYAATIVGALGLLVLASDERDRARDHGVPTRASSVRDTEGPGAATVAGSVR